MVQNKLQKLMTFQLSLVRSAFVDYWRHVCMDLYDLSSLQTNSVFLEDSIQVFKYSTLADSGEPENLATPPRECGAL